MAYVFISYSSKNQDTAEAVCQALENSGMKAWIAPRDIPAGKVYQGVITKAIEGCGCFLLLLSNDSQESKHVQREVNLADNYDKEIIPVTIEEIKVNEFFQYYCNLQAIPCYDVKNGKQINGVMEAVAKSLGIKLKESSPKKEIELSQEEIDKNARAIVETMALYKIEAEVVNVVVGLAFSRYDITVPFNVSVRKVLGLNEEIAFALRAQSGINMYVNAEKNAISIEIPNSKRSIVSIFEAMEGEEYVNAGARALSVVIGKGVEGSFVYDDICKMQHTLIGGIAASGKSSFIHSMILSLISKYTPEQLRFILIDPKKLELSIYMGMPHLLVNEIISGKEKAVVAFEWAIQEVERRLNLFLEKTKSGVSVRNIDEYNESLIEGERRLPKIVIVVDELADLMSVAKRDIEERIQRLTQKARAAGVYLVLATQRPSVDVITGVIKSNFPTRIAFRVASEIASRVLLDETGAQKLLGFGDMFYKRADTLQRKRLQSAFVLAEEIASAVKEAKQKYEAYFDPQVEEYFRNVKIEEVSDKFGAEYLKALEYCVKEDYASIPFIQRKVGVGYNHAGKILEWMEQKGYVTPNDGNRVREVLLTQEKFDEIYGGKA